MHQVPFENTGWGLEMRVEDITVAEVGKDCFVVKAREGDPNVTFAWRLSAHRKGYVGVRLDAVLGGEPAD